jgi:uncharacterized membrane protein YccC
MAVRSDRHNPAETRVKYFIPCKRIWAWLGAHRAELRFCLRNTIAGVLAFAISQLFTTPLHGLWVVLTAVLVTQMSAGRSLRATLQYLIGTVGGAIYAAMVGILVPHVTPVGEAAALALAIAPLSLVEAFTPTFRIAPFSSVMVLMMSSRLSEGPFASALYRIFEVALGGAVAVVVSLLIFPERARVPHILRSQKKQSELNQSIAGTDHGNRCD